jgi:hypothetical protein
LKTRGQTPIEFPHGETDEGVLVEEEVGIRFHRGHFPIIPATRGTTVRTGWFLFHLALLRSFRNHALNGEAVGRRLWRGAQSAPESS